MNQRHANARNNQSNVPTVSTNTNQHREGSNQTAGCNNKLVLTSGQTVQSSVVRVRGKILFQLRTRFKYDTHLTVRFGTLLTVRNVAYFVPHSVCVAVWVFLFCISRRACVTP